MTLHAEDHDWDGDTCRRCDFDFVDAAALQAVGDPYPPCVPRPTRVVNKTKGAFDVDISAPSVWANPFRKSRLGDGADRAEVIATYEAWLRAQPQLMARLPELRGLRLGCWCWPKPCHGDVLARLADEVPMETIETDDLTDAPVTVADIAGAIKMTEHALLHFALKMPADLAVELPNIRRCLMEFQESRRVATEGEPVSVTASRAPEPFWPTLSPDPSTLILDTETTGINRDTDEIIEVCIQFGFDTPEGLAPSRTWLVKPSKPIPTESSKIHGITDEHVKDAPTFAEILPELDAAFEAAAVIIGYNVAFDLGMIDSAYRRCLPATKRAPWDWGKKVVIDGHHLWRQMEPRKLADAYRTFVGGEMENAHSAEADVRATGASVLGMLDRYELLGKEWTEIQLLIDPDRAKWLGPSRHIQWKNGAVTVAFGKNSGTDILRIDPGFLDWVIGKDFPGHVKTICRAAIAVVRNQRTAEQFIGWCTTCWPPPVDE